MNYTSTIEELSLTKRKFKISVFKDDVAEAFKTSLTNLQATTEVRGFRKGKAPLGIIKKYYIDKVANNAAESLVNSTIEKAFSESGLQIISRPEVTFSKFGETEDLIYEALVDVNPTVDIVGYKELILKSSLNSVTEETVEKFINSILMQQADYKEIKDRGIKEEDLVYLYCLTKENEDISFHIDPNKTDDFTLMLRDKFLNKNLNYKEELTLTFPENFFNTIIAGKTVDLSVTIAKIAERILPTLDTKFIEPFGTKNVDEFKKHIRDMLLQREEERHIDDMGDQITEQLLEKNKFEVPDSLVKSTIEKMSEEENRNKDKKERLHLSDKEKEERYMNTALKEVRAVLALGNIARLEGITVEKDEITNELIKLSHLYHMLPKDLVAKGGQMVFEEARGRVLINKTIKHLVGINKFEQKQDAISTALAEN